MITISEKAFNDRAAKMPPEYEADVRVAVVKAENGMLFLNGVDYERLTAKWATKSINKVDAPTLSKSFSSVEKGCGCKRDRTQGRM